MTRAALLLLLGLALAGCHGQNGSETSGPAGPTSGNATSGQPSGANGTPSGGAQT